VVRWLPLVALRPMHARDVNPVVGSDSHRHGVPAAERRCVLHYVANRLGGPPMTPHRHRWVKGLAVQCTALVNGGPCSRKAVVGCWDAGAPPCGPDQWISGRCLAHDPRRPPTPAEREERRVLLRAMTEFFDCHIGGCPRCEFNKSVGAGLDALDAILESAAYSWTGGPRTGGKASP
jgi:hypothetical protein